MKSPELPPDNRSPHAHTTSSASVLSIAPPSIILSSSAANTSKFSRGNYLSSASPDDYCHGKQESQISYEFLRVQAAVFVFKCMPVRTRAG